MRWPGTIQPSRFLSHTGLVLPGVRRVVQVPNPAAGSDWSVVVPGGVQWVVIGGTARLTCSATVGNRTPGAYLAVDGVDVLKNAGSVGCTAGFSLEVSVTSDPAVAGYVSTGTLPAVVFPMLPLPEGTLVGSFTTSIVAGDQWSAISLWVEEVYVTDPQLSEDARLHAELERDIAAYEYEQAQRAGQG